ncbi:MAG: ribosome biogenesis GTPase Der [Acidobacteria bacterium SCN 69-37]|nr:MAG: ribosome biogenesis GTPase Der [Acidobacteria bacterium SCN 69-37]
MSRQSSPTVVLVGRPNVGKSTLFNRITGTRRSIVAPIAGTTRDVIAAPAAWKDAAFTLVDTGGLFGATSDPLHAMVVEHGLKAIETADVLVFVVDAQEGLVTGDEEIARRLHRAGRPVLVAINKTDDKRSRTRAIEFYRLGFETAIDVAAEHGTGVYELLDAILDRLPRVGAPSVDEEEETRIAFVGRPNVGKSSLVNRLLREERVMVSELPGTTRDTIDVVLNWKKRRLRILDTPGMRRPGRVASAGQIEAVSVVLAKRAMARADVVVLVVDAEEGAGDREGAIAGEAAEAGCGVVIAVNKWDLVRGQGQDWVKAFDDKLRFQLKFLDYAPLVHVSALTGERTPRLLEVIDRVATARRFRVPTSDLNRFLEAVTASHPPVSKSRRDVRILYGAQTAVAPPTFVLFTNVATELHFSYERFLVNRIRESFGFEGTPIRLTIRRRERKSTGKARE